MNRLRNLILTLSSFAALFLLAVPAALAERSDHGQGLYGDADDKVVTYTGFIVMTFFVVFVFAMTMLQRKLDKRKDAKIAAREGHALRFKGGW